jgi:protein-tyrosine kinase
MSIIERVAELLGSVPETRPTPTVAGAEADTIKPSLIERASGDIGRYPDFSGDRNLSGASRAKRHPTGTASRTLKVDRNRLRRQSMIVPDGERTPITESFRHVKRPILASVARPRTDAPPANLVLVTSALPGEGKTFCAINLAISIAMELDSTVLLVDADVAKPSVPQAFGLEAEKGLMDILLDRQIDLAEVIWRTDIGKLALMPAGTAHKQATEVLASAAMHALLREIAERYQDRIVILDSPPLLGASEAAVLASQMGQIIVVVEAEKTSEAVLKDALSRIDSSKVTGLLLNKGGSPRPGYGYGVYG